MLKGISQGTSGQKEQYHPTPRNPLVIRLGQKQAVMALSEGHS